MVAHSRRNVHICNTSGRIHRANRSKVRSSPPTKQGPFALALLLRPRFRALALARRSLLRLRLAQKRLHARPIAAMVHAEDAGTHKARYHDHQDPEQLATQLRHNLIHQAPFIDRSGVRGQTAAPRTHSASVYSARTANRALYAKGPLPSRGTGPLSAYGVGSRITPRRSCGRWDPRGYRRRPGRPAG